MTYVMRLTITSTFFLLIASIPTAPLTVLNNAIYDCLDINSVQGWCTANWNSVFFFIASGVGLSPLYCGHFWPIVPAPDDRWGWLWSNWWNEDRQGNPKYSEKTCPGATLSTTNPTWPDPASNPGRRGGKPATNRLSYGVAVSIHYWHLMRSEGHAAAQLVETLCYKPEGHWIFKFAESFQPHYGPGFNSASDVSTRNLPGGKERPTGA
jgi:hypothetical protein